MALPLEQVRCGWQVVKRLKALGLDDSYTEQPLNTYDEILKKYPGEWLQVHVMARVSAMEHPAHTVSTWQ